MTSFGEVWRNAKDKLYKSPMINQVVASQWIDSLEMVGIRNDTAIFSCPTEFQRDMIMRWQPNIKEALFQTLGFDVNIVITTPETQPVETAPVVERVPDEASPFGNGFSVLATYTFDNFIVGSGNKFAQAAATRVAEKPGTEYNPLFIYGESGLGKTHLMCAIGNTIKRKNQNANVIYVKGEDFANELISAIKNGSTAGFRDKYRKADVFLVDDVQFIGGKASTEEEVFHTFNTIYNAGKQIVLTSDRPPKEIATLEDRLRTRFESGLLADVTAPDYETRCAIINKKADDIGIKIPADVVDMLATRLKSNIRQIEGAVQKLRAKYMLLRQDITKELALSIVNEIGNESVPVEVTIRKILEEVAKFYNVSVEDLKGKKKTSEVALARQVSMFVIRDVTELSYPSIAALYGKDHTTVLYAIDKIKSRMENDYKLKSEVNDFLKNLKV